MKGCGRILDFGCFLDLAFDPLAEDEREEEERAGEEELDIGAFKEGLSLGIEPPRKW